MHNETAEAIMRLEAWFGVGGHAETQPFVDDVRLLIDAAKRSQCERRTMLECAALTGLLAGGDERGDLGDEERRERRLRYLAESTRAITDAVMGEHSE